MSWQSYVARTIGADQQKDAAEKAGLDQSAISRWLRSGKPGTAENVAAFARGYRRPVLEAFLAAGFITPAEAKQRPAAEPNLSQLTNDELLELVRTRMREEVVGNAEHPAATITELRAVASGGAEPIESLRASIAAAEANLEQLRAMLEMEIRKQGE